VISRHSGCARFVGLSHRATRHVAWSAASHLNRLRTRNTTSALHQQFSEDTAASPFLDCLSRLRARSFPSTGSFLPTWNGLRPGSRYALLPPTQLSRAHKTVAAANIFLVNFDQCLQPRSLILTIDNALPGRCGQISSGNPTSKAAEGNIR
jgi:hypothetical protein